jgi:hypothetical protein
MEGRLTALVVLGLSFSLLTSCSSKKEENEKVKMKLPQQVEVKKEEAKEETP